MLKLLAPRMQSRNMSSSRQVSLPSIFCQMSRTELIQSSQTNESFRVSFSSSVTEREFHLGLQKDKPSALLFVREVPLQRGRDGPRRLARFMDVTADGLLDAEAQSLLKDLKSHLYGTYKNILNLHCVELSKGGVDPKRKDHAQYLDSICEEFVSQMKTRIQAAVDSAEDGGRRKVWGNIDQDQDVSDCVLEDLRQHSAMCVEMCRGFHGREGLLGKLCLAVWESTKVRHGPLVVHGAAGIGKTALLCKLAQEMHTVMEATSVLVVRLLSCDLPQRTDLDRLLHSLCLQICLACGLAPPTPLTANTHQDLVQFFQKLLVRASQQGNMLLIVLDALDQLSDRGHAHKLRWLPVDLPPHVHLLVSMETQSEVFANMRLKMKTPECFFEVERLSDAEGRHILDTSLRARQRTLTPEQNKAALRSFERSGSPLHLTLILSAAKRWMSFTPLDQLRLGTSAQEMMALLLQTLEEKHGLQLVGAALGYIALGR